MQYGVSETGGVYIRRNQQGIVISKVIIGAGITCCHCRRVVVSLSRCVVESLSRCVASVGFQFQSWYLTRLVSFLHHQVYSRCQTASSLGWVTRTYRPECQRLQ